MGVIVLDDKGKEIVVEMIAEQTKIPCSIDGDFTYAYDNMTAVRVEITEGIGNVRDEVNIVGELLLENLPPRRKGAPIKVTYTYNRDKTLNIEVIDLETGKKGQGRVALAGGMTEEEMRKSSVSKMKQE